ncbi:MAG: hypothetical protein PHS60_11465 [Zavarzinia sp.]|nr:hypothetical protein [Zavarzinia sp.]
MSDDLANGPVVDFDHDADRVRAVRNPAGHLPWPAIKQLALERDGAGEEVAGRLQALVADYRADFPGDQGEIVCISGPKLQRERGVIADEAVRVQRLLKITSNDVGGRASDDASIYYEINGEAT